MSPGPPATSPMPAPALTRAGRVSLNLVLVLAAAGAIGWLAVQLRLVVLPVLLALGLATILWPAVAWLRGRGWPPALAAGGVLGLSLLALGASIAALVPTVAGEIGDLGVSARDGVEEVVGWLTGGPLNLTREEVDAGVDRVLDRLRAEAGGVSRVVTGAVVVAEVIAGVLLAVVLLFFGLKDRPAIRGFALEYVPARHRDRAAAAASAAWTALGGYLRGVAVVAVVDSVLIGIALLVLGVPLVVPLMALTFFGAFIPLVGAVVAGAVAALVALVTQGAIVALIVVGVIVVVQQVEGDVLYPLVVGRAIELHPAAILLALTAGSVTAGVIGALVAVPVVGAAWSARSAWRGSRGQAPLDGSARPKRVHEAAAPGRGTRR